MLLNCMDNNPAKSVGISFPSDFLKIIDKDRGDVPRSKYIINILRKTYVSKIDDKIILKKLNSLEFKTGNLPSSEFTNP